MEAAVLEEEAEGCAEEDFEEARCLQALVGEPPGSLQQQAQVPAGHRAAAAVNEETTGAGRGLMGGVVDEVEAAEFMEEGEGEDEEGAAAATAGGGGGGEAVHHQAGGRPGLEAGARFAAELLPAEARGAGQGMGRAQEQLREVDMFAAGGEEEAEGGAAAPQLSQQQSSDLAAAGPFAARAPPPGGAAWPEDVDVTSGPLGAVSEAVGHLAQRRQQLQQQQGAPPAEAAAAAPAGRGGGGGWAEAWPVEVRLLGGGAFSEVLRQPQGWGGLAGCDVAALVEVVEHLDPGPLALLGPCLLGGRPPSCPSQPAYLPKPGLPTCPPGLLSAGWPGCGPGPGPHLGPTAPPPTARLGPCVTPLPAPFPLRRACAQAA
jgi:hypothetical protein